MSKPTVVSLDLAKKVIQVCKVNPYGELLFNKAMSPQKTKDLLANSPPCVVAMEGCASFHYWARVAQSFKRFKSAENDITGYHIRALCFEYGVIITLGKKSLRQAITHFISPESTDLPEQIKPLLMILWQQYQTTEEHYKAVTLQLK